MKRLIFTSFLLVMFWSLCLAQSFVPIANGLNSPLGVEVDHQGLIWVIEGGTGADDGRLLRMTALGSYDVIVSGLPSFFNPEVQELNGPLNVVLDYNGTFYIVQGGGPDELSGTILEFHISDYTIKGSALNTADARSVTYVSNWVLTNGFNESNPYSMAFDDDGNMIVADAAANALIKYNPETEEFSVFATFPSNSNPLPFGPPFIDAVPTKLMRHPDGGYLVSQLTGFPFLDGASTIFHVDEAGTVSDYASGLTLVTDMAIDPQDGKLVALQFAKFGELGFDFGSARLIKILDDKSLEVMASDFGPSPGIGIAANGNIYASNLFTGQVLVFERCGAKGGTISASKGWTENTICANDGLGDPFDIKFSNGSTHSVLVITDASGNLLKVVGGGNRIDLEGSGVGTCKVWNVAYDGELPSFVIGSSIYDLGGCVALSNPITIDRLDCQGCHVPLNLRAAHRAQGGYDITWSQVKSAVNYRVVIGYKDEPWSFVNLPSRRNRTVLYASSDRTILLSVAAVCGFTTSEYTEYIEITPPKGSSYKRAEAFTQNNSEFLIETGEISISPNPASEFLNIDAGYSSENSTIEIYDLSGSKRLHFIANNENQIQKLDIKNLNPGIYLVAVSQGGEVIVREKMVVAR